MEDTGMRGLFLTFEGADGSGKSTHIRLLEHALRQKGYDVVSLHEPGGTKIGELLRSIILEPENSGMSDRCELMLYEAARAQLIDEVIEPALSRGAVVLCDRFTDSTIAYQGYGRGIDPERISGLNDYATNSISPDRTLYFYCEDAEEGLERAQRHGREADRLESEGTALQDRVLAGYYNLCLHDPSRIKAIDSRGTKEETIRQVFAELTDLFGWMAEIGDEDYFEELVSWWEETKGPCA
ncbi:MAG: dTMP kinase [Eggerthellaceae bacterium]|nr:dTMP kinase [Eggerthellaceae bacterium]